MTPTEQGILDHYSRFAPFWNKDWVDAVQFETSLMLPDGTVFTIVCPESRDDPDAPVWEKGMRATPFSTAFAKKWRFRMRFGVQRKHQWSASGLERLFA